MNVIALTGHECTGLNELSAVYSAAIGGAFSDRAQDMHINILHMFIERVKRHFHPANDDRNMQC